MKKGLLWTAGLLLTMGFSVHSQDNSMKLDFDGAEQVINKNIYGQFAEHLGRCIYDGIWVGPDSDIPNENGYRRMFWRRLKNFRYLCFVGRAAALPTPIIGKMV